jgi:glucokinase
MGPGTGLGAAQMMWDEGRQRYKVWPGEGAHATLAPRGWKQAALSDYVTQKEGHCEIEFVSARSPASSEGGHLVTCDVDV